MAETAAVNASSIIWQGIIPRARPVLEAMRASGMYLSTQLLDLTLAEVGE